MVQKSRRLTLFLATVTLDGFRMDSC